MAGESHAQRDLRSLRELYGDLLREFEQFFKSGCPCEGLHPSIRTTSTISNATYAQLCIKIMSRPTVVRNYCDQPKDPRANSAGGLGRKSCCWGCQTYDINSILLSSNLRTLNDASCPRRRVDVAVPACESRTAQREPISETVLHAA